MSSETRIFALTIEDLTAIPPNELKKLAGRYTFWALDGKAHYELMKNNFNVRYFWDLLTVEEQKKIYNDIVRMDDFWFNTLSESFQDENIKWMKYDYYGLPYLRNLSIWHIHFYNAYLLKKIKSLEELRFIKSNPGRIFFNNFPNDVIKDFWTNHVENSKPIHIDYHERSMHLDIREFSYPPSSVVENRIVFMFNFEELPRYDRTIKNIHHALKENFIIASIFPGLSDIQGKNLNRIGVPFILPGMTRRETKTISRDETALEKLLKHPIARKYHLRKIADHFEFYFHYRWPKLYHNYKETKKFIQKTAAVIVSNTGDLESLLPAIAAGNLNKNALVFPHAPSVLFPWKKAPCINEKGIRYCCQNKQDRKSYLDAGIDESSLLLCKSLVFEGYRLNRSVSFTDIHGLKRRNIFIEGSLKDIRNLLANKSNALNSDRLLFLVKAHPLAISHGYDKLGGEFDNIKVIDSRYSLDPVIHYVDACIFIHKMGSAVYHAQKIGKPAFYIGESLEIENMVFPLHESIDATSISFNGIFDTVADFWDHIDILTDQKLFENEVRFSRDLARNNLDDEGHPDIVDYLTPLLSGAASECAALKPGYADAPSSPRPRPHSPDASERRVETPGERIRTDPVDIRRRTESAELSVVIPTFNRAEFLSRTVESILAQTLSPAEYEIIVVDNNSSDHTKRVVEDLNRKHGNRIRYVFEPDSGLVYARHTGAREARADILVFTDDDIIAPEGWLAAIRQTFTDPDVALVGGKNIPRYEAAPPEWIDAFWNKNELGVWNIYISLLDLGERQIEIPANFVFGCNFSIRKRVMYECGGFHPDVVPRELIRFLGDGEYGLALALMKKGCKAVYNPAASIEHLVPEGRMTVEYFCRRAFGEGVTNSYTQIREKGAILDDMVDDPGIIDKANQFANAIMHGTLNVEANTTGEIRELVRYSHRQGVLYHQNQVRNDPNLLSWVLRKDYFTDDAPPPGRKREKTKPEKPSMRSLPQDERTLTTEAIFSKRAISFSNEGRRFMNERLYQDALNCFDNAMYLNPTLGALHHLRGECLFKLGRIPEATAAARAEIKSNPEFKPARSLLASLREPARSETMKARISRRRTEEPPGTAARRKDAEPPPQKAGKPPKKAARPFGTIPLKSIQWIVDSRLDPTGRIFKYEGEFYRAIYTHATQKVKHLFQSNLIQSLVEKKLLIESEITDLMVPGFGLVIHHKRIPFTSSMEEWPQKMFLDAAKKVVEINLELLDSGFITIDYHAHNIQQDYNANPVWIDLGSIIPRSRIPVKNMYLEFAGWFIHYLILLSKYPDLDRVCRSLMESGPISIPEFKALTGVQLNVPLKTREGLLHYIREWLDEFRFPEKKTRWENYYVEKDSFQLWDTSSDSFRQPDTRAGILYEIIEKHKPGNIIDLGCNTGFFSVLASDSGADVCAIDYDEGALEVFYEALSSSSRRLPITIVQREIGSARAQRLNRIQGDFVMALAITHHMSLGQKKSFNHIAYLLSLYSRDVLVTEFMPDGLGVGAPHPNPLPRDYTLENFKTSFTPYFNTIKHIQYPSVKSKRIFVVCEGRTSFSELVPTPS